MMNELRIAAADFRAAMTAVGVARERLAEAVAAEFDMPNGHERDRETRDALLQLRARLEGASFPKFSAPRRGFRTRTLRRPWLPKLKERKSE